VGRKKQTDQAWKRWQTSLEEGRRVAGVEIADRVLDWIRDVDRRLRGKNEARTWSDQLSKLGRARRLLEDVDQDLHLRGSSIFSREPEPGTWREAIEAALKNQLLNTIAGRVFDGNEVLPAGTTPQRVKRTFQENLKIAAEAIGKLERLSKAIGEAYSGDRRTGAIAAGIAEIERSESIQLAPSTVAYLDLAAREAALGEEGDWIKLRQQWEVALRRARQGPPQDSERQTAT
jgi:hypothetical protein